MGLLSAVLKISSRGGGGGGGQSWRLKKEGEGVCEVSMKEKEIWAIIRPKA